ncbi:MAG: S41 family peptidase [candidate division WOR-3 bacterium]|nr:MAG: S41 family peptidase [candidate division WOR-3 bacterium]
MMRAYKQINVIHAVLAVFLISGFMFARQNNTLAEMQQKEIIDELCRKLESIYPFPEIAERTISGLQEYYMQGKYRDYTDKSEFASNLTVDLEQLSNDTHFYLAYNPGLAADLIMAENQEVLLDSLTAQEADIEKWNNYGFKELKILDGAIGYLDLRLFFSPYYAGDVAVAAMNFFANCNAIIIDLRYNGGGWDDMVNFLLSYFAESRDEVIFNVGQNTIDSVYYAGTTVSYVPGKRLTGIPVYVLISAGTASAAEAFASRIKFINSNALLVGEKTAGAENPISTIVIGDEFILNIPSWRKVYQKYDADWEVVGVKPDIEAPAEKTLAAAHIHALRRLVETAVEKKAEDKYEWALDGVLAIYEPVSLPEDVLQSYAGNYGNRDVYFEDGLLYYQYKKRTKRVMLPVREDYFVVEHYDFFRVRFAKDKGRVTVLEEIFTDGSVTRCTRTSE